MNSNFIQILNKLKIGNDESDTNYNKNYKLEANDYNVTITPVNYLKSDLKTYEESIFPGYFNFTECEEILREQYSIPNNKVIGLFRIDLNNPDENGNAILYRAYIDNSKTLNLTICMKIPTTIPTTIITTIPTTIITAIPTTIITTIPTTIVTTISTTIITTIPTTIITTIATTTYSTIPTTISTIIPTTISTTISTAISTKSIYNNIYNNTNDYTHKYSYFNFPHKSKY